MVVNTLGNGNCLIASILYAVDRSWTINPSRAMRRTLAQEVEEGRLGNSVRLGYEEAGRIADFRGGVVDVLRAVQNVGGAMNAYLDEPHLIILAEYLHINITIYSPNPSDPSQLQTTVIEDPTGQAARSINILYNGSPHNGHYWSLVPPAEDETEDLSTGDKGNEKVEDDPMDGSRGGNDIGGDDDEVMGDDPADESVDRERTPWRTTPITREDTRLPGAKGELPWLSELKLLERSIIEDDLRQSLINVSLQSPANTLIRHAESSLSSINTW